MKKPWANSGRPCKARPRAAIYSTFGLITLAATQMLWGIDAAPPRRGFEQNTGQFDAGVLFGRDGRNCYRDKIQLSGVTPISLEFVNSSPGVTITGQDQRPVPLHVYLGSDQRRWRENVPHFSSIRYSEVYPGINIELRADPDLPMFRITVAPGADASLLRLRLAWDNDPNFSLRFSQVSISVASATDGSFVFDQLVAYQPFGEGRARLMTSFVALAANTFRPGVGFYDASRPLIFEFGTSTERPMYVSAVQPAKNDSAVITGRPPIFGLLHSHGYIAGVSTNGTLSFLTLLDGVDPAWFVAGASGELTIAGVVNRRRTVGFLSPGIAYPPGEPPPVTGDAPESVSRGDFDESRGVFQEGWVGRFDSSGRLVASTYTGGLLQSLAVGPGGDIFFSTPETLVKWTPGHRRFAYSLPIRNISSLAANASGGIAFCAADAGGQPTTAGAPKLQYEGPEDVYVGRIDGASGSLQMATYIPIVGRGTVPAFRTRSTVALAPRGDVWVASDLSLSGQILPVNTVVSVSADGSRVLYSKGELSSQRIAFDTAGNVLMVSSTEWQGLPASLDAPWRAGCSPGGLARNLYLQTLSPDGLPLSATYLPGINQIEVFDGPDRLFAGSWRDRTYTGSSQLRGILDRVPLNRPATPGIDCTLHTSSREAITEGAPGGLFTLTGNQLGPLIPANAALDAAGGLPRQLAGVEVLVNELAAPIVSVQRGLVTFQIPESIPLGSARIAIRAGGVEQCDTTLRLTNISDFAILTTDGTGRGQPAALNEDGSLNTKDNPARSGSVVALFGTGAIAARNPISVDRAPVRIEYAGDAPGLIPGVKQVNIRMPVFSTAAAAFLIVSSAPSDRPPSLLYVRP